MSDHTLKELCNSLRSNDPSITDLSIQISDRDRLSALLGALQQNGHVASLTLDFNGLKSNRTFQCPRLFRYLSESKVLRRVTLACARYSGCSDLPKRLVRALTENPLIEEATFRAFLDKYWHDDVLAFLQRKPHSLKRLSLFLRSWTTELCLAIGSLQALERFSASLLVNCPMDLMLQPLQHHRCLRTLRIIAPFRSSSLDDTLITLPVSSLLRSEVPLESLELHVFEFNQDQLMPLLNAMNSCPTLVRLVLTGDMEIEAAREMTAWFRQPQECFLRELCLGGDYYFQHESATVMSSILTPLEGSSPQQSSAGACLRVLDVDVRHVRDLQLLEALATERCQLRTLSLRELNEDTWRQLTRYLPDMMSLRELNVKFVLGDCNPSTFVRALRQNGSLHTVFAASVRTGRIDALFSTAELRRIQSSCDRNRWAAESLQELKDGGLLRREDATLLYLCPLLLRAVKPARRMAPNAFLSGLLACDEAIGPRGRAKRIAS
jgi:hypothetical protein